MQMLPCKREEARQKPIASPCHVLGFEPCSSVLQRLKAALDDALASFVRRPENVAQLWDRLVHSVVVQPRSLHESSGALPRADITYQLNEIEVSQRLCIGGAIEPPPLLMPGQRCCSTASAGLLLRPPPLTAPGHR